jgi:hypothetical protein
MTNPTISHSLAKVEFQQGLLGLCFYISAHVPVERLFSIRMLLEASKHLHQSRLALKLDSLSFIDMARIACYMKGARSSKVRSGFFGAIYASDDDVICLSAGFQLSDPPFESSNPLDCSSSALSHPVG